VQFQITRQNARTILDKIVKVKQESAFQTARVPQRFYIVKKRALLPESMDDEVLFNP
jgi:hypothetical protein